MAKTIPFTEARSKLTELLDELERRHEHVVITRNGRPGVLIPAAEFDAIEEILEVLQDEDLLQALRQSEEDVKAGRLSTLSEVRRELGIG